MSIAQYISDEIFKPRLQKSACLVVYDPDGRYHELCMNMKNDELSVIDASESSIESREAALKKNLKKRKKIKKKNK